MTYLGDTSTGPRNAGNTTLARSIQRHANFGGGRFVPAAWMHVADFPNECVSGMVAYNRNYSKRPCPRGPARGTSCTWSLPPQGPPCVDPRTRHSCRESGSLSASRRHARGGWFRVRGQWMRAGEAKFSAGPKEHSFRRPKSVQTGRKTLDRAWLVVHFAACRSHNSHNSKQTAENVVERRNHHQFRPCHPCGGH